MTIQHCSGGRGEEGEKFQFLSSTIFPSILFRIVVVGIVVSSCFKTNNLFSVIVEGMSQEEEVDDQLLWNLQILSEVNI